WARCRAIGYWSESTALSRRHRNVRLLPQSSALDPLTTGPASVLCGQSPRLSPSPCARGRGRRCACRVGLAANGWLGCRAFQPYTLCRLHLLLPAIERNASHSFAFPLYPFVLPHLCGVR